MSESTDYTTLHVLRTSSAIDDGASHGDTRDGTRERFEHGKNGRITCLHYLQYHPSAKKSKLQQDNIKASSRTTELNPSGPKYSPSLLSLFLTLFFPIRSDCTNHASSRWLTLSVTDQQTQWSRYVGTNLARPPYPRAATAPTYNIPYTNMCRRSHKAQK